MSGLLERLAPRAAAEPVVVTTAGALYPAGLQDLGPAPDIGPSSRLAVSIADPLRLVEVLLALDGRVRTLLLVSYAQPAGVVRALSAAAGCPLIVSDRTDLAGQAADDTDVRAPAAVLGGGARAAQVKTDWLMTTSGTTGMPKIVPHDLNSLARTVTRAESGAGGAPVWGLLYDPTRFAGLQVALQALIGGGRLVAPDTARPLAEQVAVLAAHGCSHLSATPTLWRRLLMLPDLDRLALRQVTLGGEIVGQDVLDALRAGFPAARITHIYASTEAGVGFAVNDGRAGFPARYLGAAPGGVRMKLVDGVLWLRPPAGATAAPGVRVDAEGFVCSEDRIEVADGAAGGRAHFLGRANGMINVGGVKVHPEVVERAIQAVPGVRLAKVGAKPSPITGALILAEILADEGIDRAALKAEVLRHCRTTLDREAVPAILRFVDNLETNAAGKLIRHRAEGAAA